MTTAVQPQCVCTPLSLSESFPLPVGEIIIGYQFFLLFHILACSPTTNDDDVKGTVEHQREHLPCCLYQPTLAFLVCSAAVRLREIREKMCPIA